MYTTTELNPRKVKDLDFTFVNGTRLSVTLDTELGDELNLGSDTVIIKVKERKNKDSFLVSGESKLTLFIRNIVSIHETERVIQDLTPDQQYDFQQALAELGIPTTKSF